MTPTAAMPLKPPEIAPGQGCGMPIKPQTVPTNAPITTASKTSRIIVRSLAAVLMSAMGGKRTLRNGIAASILAQ